MSAKKDLLRTSEEQFKKLFDIIDSVPYSKRKISIKIEERDKNFRDVLMHLYEWHAMLERWYREGMNDDVPSTPAPGYKWRDINQLNIRIRDNYQDVTINQAIKRVRLSHDRVMKLIESHSDEEIMTKKYYKWTKTSNLYSYFAANTSKHYQWAIKKCEVIAKEIMRKEN